MIPRNVLTSVPGSFSFRTPLESESVHGFQTPLKPALQHLYPNFPLNQEKLSLKTSLLVRSQILGLFGKTLTANHMYFRHKWEKFRQEAEIISSQKRKTFSLNSIAFLQATQNFVHFEKEDQLHSLNISEVIGPRKCGYFNTRKPIFYNTLRESTCSRVRITAEACTAVLL